MGKDSQRIRDFMLAQMRDSAHDAQHVLRVTRAALAIARAYPQVDVELLEAAALLRSFVFGNRMMWLFHEPEPGECEDFPLSERQIDLFLDMLLQQ